MKYTHFWFRTFTACLGANWLLRHSACTLFPSEETLFLKLLIRLPPEPTEMSYQSYNVTYRKKERRGSLLTWLLFPGNPIIEIYTVHTWSGRVTNFQNMNNLKLNLDPLWVHFGPFLSLFSPFLSRIFFTWMGPVCTVLKTVANPQWKILIIFYLWKVSINLHYALKSEN